MKCDICKEKIREIDGFRTTYIGSKKIVYCKNGCDPFNTPVETAFKIKQNVNRILENGYGVTRKGKLVPPDEHPYGAKDKHGWKHTGKQKGKKTFFQMGGK